MSTSPFVQSKPVTWPPEVQVVDVTSDLSVVMTTTMTHYSSLYVQTQAVLMPVQIQMSSGGLLISESGTRKVKGNQPVVGYRNGGVVVFTCHRAFGRSEKKQMNCGGNTPIMIENLKRCMASGRWEVGDRTLCRKTEALMKPYVSQYPIPYFLFCFLLFLFSFFSFLLCFSFSFLRSYPPNVRPTSFFLFLFLQLVLPTVPSEVRRPNCDRAE